jgi:hypothetical protein
MPSSTSHQSLLRHLRLIAVRGRRRRERRRKQEGQRDKGRREEGRREKGEGGKGGRRGKMRDISEKEGEGRRMTYPNFPET